MQFGFLFIELILLLSPDGLGLLWWGCFFFDFAGFWGLLGLGFRGLGEVEGSCPGCLSIEVDDEAGEHLGLN